MNEVYLLTGGNLGDRVRNLELACSEISIHCGRVVRKSSIYETAAWGNTEQPSFLNQVLEINTTLTPEVLLTSLLRIEQSLGRVRDARYGPRLIDIDILFYGNRIIDQPGISIPHPRMALRRFVLVPLNELAPEKIHPVTGKTVAQLLADCTDPLSVNKFN